MSEERDKDHFESLSGFVVSRHANVIELHILYPIEQESPNASASKTSFKLTSESLGNGIQVMTDLIKVAAGNIFHLQLRGTPELFQRRKTSRVNTTIRMFHLQRDLSLTFFRKEWKRIVEYMKTRGLPPNLVLQDNPINLSIGGIRLSIAANSQTSPLSMFFLDLNDELPPVCALAETVWNKQEEEELLCGHRFIQIQKSDQERINRFVQSVQKKMGIPVTTGKVNWELLDRMTYDGSDQHS